MKSIPWRVGRKVPINVYEGDRPVCQCHTALDARLIVKAVNSIKQLQQKIYDAAQLTKPKSQRKP